MKPDIHPDYVECTVRCSCGNTFKTRSTKPELVVDLCNECHPFFTGQQKFVDTGGRVQRFSNKFGSAADQLKERKAAEKAAKQARQALAAIQEEWDQIGYVPRDDMHRIESRLDAVDKQIKAVEDAAWKQSDPEADARKSSFEEQLNAQLAELDAQIAAESNPKKKAKLEAEKATKEQWLNAIK